MKTREINALVEPAYRALHVLNNITWTGYRDRCFEMACAEERQHRRGAPNDWRWPKGCSIQAAGRLFVVRRIAENLLGAGRGGHLPTLADVLHYQPSAIYAASIVANHRERIAEAWKTTDVAKLADLDYVQFVNNGENK